MDRPDPVGHWLGRPRAGSVDPVPAASAATDWRETTELVRTVPAGARPDVRRLRAGGQGRARGRRTPARTGPASRRGDRGAASQVSALRAPRADARTGPLALAPHPAGMVAR